MHEDLSRFERIVPDLRETLTRAGLDAWIVFTRESSPDPVASYVGADKAVARLACLFGRIDGVERRVALCASYDTQPIAETGLFDEIVAYRAEGIKPLLASWVPRLEGRIGINTSRDISVADGLASGMRAYLEDAIGAETSRRLTSAERFIVELIGGRTPEEVAIIEEAVRRTQKVARAALCAEHIRAGTTTEKDLAAVMQRMVEAGGDRVEFVTIVVGPDRGHSDPTDRVMVAGDLLRIDFGIRHCGFCSDIQRTAYLLAPGESSPPSAIEHMWQVNRASFKAALAVLRPGATGLEVDTAARAVVVEGGYESYPHAAGHCLGTRVHEIGPILGPDWPERYGCTVHLPIRENQVLAVEPAVCASDPRTSERIHIGLEHDVVVTADGCRIIGEDQEDIWLIAT